MSGWRGARSAPRQPALDRPDGAAKVPRRFLVAPTLEVAEQDRDAVPFRQAVDLLVDDGCEPFFARLSRGPGSTEGFPLDYSPAIRVPTPRTPRDGRLGTTRGRPSLAPIKTFPTGEDQEGNGLRKAIGGRAEARTGPSRKILISDPRASS